MTLVTLMRLTLLELWRQRLVLLPGGMAALLLLLAFANLAEGVPGDVTPWLEQLKGSLAYLLATAVLPGLGVFLGIIGGAGLIANEIDRGTILLLASKPPARALIVLGKGLGGFAYLLISFGVWGLVMAAIWAFKGSPALFGPILGITLLGVLPAWLYAAIALAASTRLPALTAAGMGLGAFLINLLASGVLAMKMMPFFAGLAPVAHAIKWIVPSDVLGGLAGELVAGKPVGAVQLAAVAAIAGWLAVAAALFQTRDLS